MITFLTVAVPNNFQLSPSQNMMLLYSDLKSKLPDADKYRLLKTICPVLPDLSPLKLYLLKKKKQDKIKLLDNLLQSTMVQELDQEVIGLLSFVTVAFQRSIENAYFEKVHWSTKCKKVAGTMIKAL